MPISFSTVRWEQMSSTALFLSSLLQRLGARSPGLPSCVLLPCCLIGLTALTVGLKIAHYTETTDLQAQHEVRLDAFLRERGWSRAGILSLNVIGDIHALRYKGDLCAGEVKIVELPSGGDATLLVDSMIGDGERLIFIHDRIVSEAPPLR